MPPPFAWPRFEGPTSIVFKDAKNLEWQDKGILVPHETIRLWNKNIMEIVQCFDPIGNPSTKWKTNVFFDWYDNYYKVCIHHHHEAEENIYNPGIKKKLTEVGAKSGFEAPSKAQNKSVGDSIKDDHVKLVADLEKMSSYRQSINSGDAKACNEFKQQISSFVTMMEQHLAEEENEYPKLLRESQMTEAEDQALVQEIVQGLGLEGNKKFLPPLVYCMCMWDGEDNAMKFVGSIPPPLQLAFHKCWVHDFNENQLKVWEALKQTEEFMPRPPECALCTVM